MIFCCPAYKPSRVGNNKITWFFLFSFLWFFMIFFFFLFSFLMIFYRNPPSFVFFLFLKPGNGKKREKSSKKVPQSWSCIHCGLGPRLSDCRETHNQNSLKEQKMTNFIFFGFLSQLTPPWALFLLNDPF